MSELVQVPPARTVKSEGATRTLRLLTSFTRERHTQTAKELATSAGIPLPSVYRYLAALKDMGLLVDDERGGYYLSARFVDLAQAAEAADNLIGVADPAMRALGAVTGELVLLVRLVNGTAVCVHRVESAHPLRVSVEPGRVLPFDDRATTPVLLSSLGTPRLRAHLDGLSPGNPALSQLLEECVGLARDRGWAVSENGNDSGIWTAAAAIRVGDRLDGVVSVPVPMARATSSVQDRVLRRVRATAAEIGAARQAEVEQRG